MADKKFFWIKLKQDFFDLEAIDWLMDQENGSDYVVLYQKLCLLTANTCGELVRQVGEMMVPYDCKKIAQQTKFPFDTVVIAMELFRKLGLIFEQTNGILRISEVNKMIGSESEWAEKKRQQRTKIGQNKDNVRVESGHYEDNVLEDRGQAEDIVQDKKGTMSDKSIEIRSKSTEIRDIYIPPTPLRGERGNTGFSETEALSQSKAGAALKAKLGEWLTYKRERRQAYKAQGLRAFLTTAEKYAERYGEGAVAELIDASMANGYQGVVWDRLKRAGGAQPEYEELT